jgi:methyl-accepting chemotaxis protein
VELLMAYAATASRSGSSMARLDALALTIGAKTTVGALVIASMLVIVLGAASMLETLTKMRDGLHTNLGQLQEANRGLDELNKTMDSVPPTADHMAAMVPIVRDTSKEMETSKLAMSQLQAGTTKLNGTIGDIAKGTGNMRVSLEKVDVGTSHLATTASSLNKLVARCAKAQAEMKNIVIGMQAATTNMNNSVAYVIRTLNYITAPPTGQSFMLRVDLDPKTLPPIPGVKATTDPVTAFQRGSWPVYKGR